MKAHFRFIGNNKMKEDFCFIESAKWCRARRAVAQAQNYATESATDFGGTKVQACTALA
jgi:hypothetical protein